MSRASSSSAARAVGAPSPDVQAPQTGQRDPAEAIIKAAVRELRAGRPVLVADDAGRENEGDAILSAHLATPEWVAWMVRHTSGYLCAPLPGELADRLRLPLMVEHSQDPQGTAYTIAVDAANRTSTGISAVDRALTLNALGSPEARPEHLIRPGHVLPLRARPGGVLERGGHTEAAVDLMRIAGLPPVGAIAEMINDDGTMVRWPQLRHIAAQEGLVALTVADIVTWRQSHERAGDSTTVDAAPESEHAARGRGAR